MHMLRTQVLRNYTNAACVATRGSTRVGIPSAARTMASTPDPTKPTSDSAFDSASSKPSGSGNNMLLWVIAGTGIAGGAYYYMNVTDTGMQDIKQQRKESEEKFKEKARELKETGKQTAHDTVQEGQEGYHELRTSGREELAHARATASQTASDVESKIDRSFEDAKNTASATYEDTINKVNQTYADAKQNVSRAYDDAAHKVEEKRQGWGEWFGSWFGYGKKKIEETKEEGAGRVAEGARKVEREAEKRK